MKSVSVVVVDDSIDAAVFDDDIGGILADIEPVAVVDDFSVDDRIGGRDGTRSGIGSEGDSRGHASISWSWPATAHAVGAIRNV